MLYVYQIDAFVTVETHLPLLESQGMAFIFREIEVFFLQIVSLQNFLRLEMLK